MNKVIIIGRNTKDIELKQLTSGASVVEFSVAVRRTFKSANGEYESDFFNCVAFSKLAEVINRYVQKGDLIALEGRLQTRNYTNGEGRKIYVTEIIAENVEFLQAKKETDEKQEVRNEADPFKPEWEEIDSDLPLPF